MDGLYFGDHNFIDYHYSSFLGPSTENHSLPQTRSSAFISKENNTPCLDLVARVRSTVCPILKGLQVYSNSSPLYVLTSYDLNKPQLALILCEDVAWPPGPSKLSELRSMGRKTSAAVRVLGV